MRQSRSTKLIAILGYTGTGKTTIEKKLIKNQLLTERPRVLLIVPDDLEFPEYPLSFVKEPKDFDFTGVKKIIPGSDTLFLVKQYFRKGLLLLNDCRAFIGAATDDDVHNFLIRRRQKMFDIAFSAHGFTEVPPKFFRFISEYVLFQTMDNMTGRKNDMRNYDQMVTAQERINEKSKENIHYHEVIRVSQGIA